jgi:hypothetical protein
MQKAKKATAMVKATLVWTISQYSSGLKNTAEGEKWFAFFPLYFFGPVMFITRYPGIQPDKVASEEDYCYCWSRHAAFVTG